MVLEKYYLEIDTPICPTYTQDLNGLGSSGYELLGHSPQDAQIQMVFKAAVENYWAIHPQDAKYSYGLWSRGWESLRH